tara:strand:- start:31 stop:414 length:384 start_codon:yes stop_codon:yes gene_type:complete
MKNFWTFFSLTWTSLIIYFSFFNPESIVEGNIPWFKNQDEVADLVFYAILGWCLIKIFSQEILLKYPIIKGLVLVHIFVVVIELGQNFFPTDRDRNLIEVLSNCMGSMLILILTYTYQKLFLLNPKI